MRLHSASPAYAELHRRLNTVRTDPTNADLSETALNAKLCEARDNYMRELQDQPPFRINKILK